MGNDDPLKRINNFRHVSFPQEGHFCFRESIDRDEDIFRNPESNCICEYTRYLTIHCCRCRSCTIEEKGEQKLYSAKERRPPGSFQFISKKFNESADVLVLVTKDNRLREAFFTTDSATGTSFTYDGSQPERVHGKNATTPGPLPTLYFLLMEPMRTNSQHCMNTCMPCQEK